MPAQGIDSLCPAFLCSCLSLFLVHKKKDAAPGLEGKGIADNGRDPLFFLIYPRSCKGFPVSCLPELKGKAQVVQFCVQVTSIRGLNIKIKAIVIASSKPSSMRNFLLFVTSHRNSAYSKNEKKWLGETIGLAMYIE